jgi:branched-chain amino acid transport system substrate-binding protein
MAVAGASADVVIGMGETAGIVRDLVKANAGPDVVPLYVTDLAPWATLAQGLTPAQSAGITGIRPGSAVDPAFVARLSAQSPDVRDFGYAAQSYDATMLIALAAQIAGSVRGRDIAAALPGVTTGHSACTTFVQCLAQVKAGQTIAYVGQAGAVRLGAQGDPLDGAVGVYRFGADGVVSPVGTYQSGTFPAAAG